MPFPSLLAGNTEERPKKSARLFDLVTANLRCLTAAMGNSDKQIISFRHEKPSASAIRRVNFSEGFIGVCVSLLDDVDLARATYRVDPMALAVVKDIIGIAGDADARDHVA